MSKRLDFAAAALLYVIQLSMILALAFAANHQAILTKEEATSGFVAPAFLALRLQHHVYSTNFYTYVFFSAAGHCFPTLFYARFAKAAAMAFLAPLVYLYLRKRFLAPWEFAFPGAVGIALLPGILCFSWVGIEIGLETVVGLLALWLALFESPVAVVASFVAAAIGAEIYGSALVFVPIVMLQQSFRLKDPRLKPAVIAGGFAMLTVMAFPLFWWTNAQTLIVGGGRPNGSGVLTRVAGLLTDLFQHADSYYFFTNHAAAMGGMSLGLACLAGLVVVGARDFSRAWPLVALVATNLAIASIGANEPGARRLLPLMLALGLGGVAAASLLCAGASWRKFAALVLLLGACAFELHLAFGIRQSLADSTIALPRDFEFRVPPGETMASTIHAFATGARKLPPDMDGYEPDRTLSILYRLTQPHPLISAAELVQACDRHGWSIPSTRPKLSRLFPRP